MRHAIHSTISAAAVAALAIIAPSGASAENFFRTINVEALVLETFLTGKQYSDEWTCGIFACPISSGAYFPETAEKVIDDPSYTLMGMGYDYSLNPGTDPCNCTTLSLAEFRGRASFRTIDIPDHFLTATLVMDAISSDKLANTTSELLVGVYESKAPKFDLPWSAVFSSNNNRPFYTFDARHDNWKFTIGYFGSTTEPSFPQEARKYSDPLFSPFPATTTANSQPIQRNGDSYRINVSSTVRNWIADWPNRLNKPIHGFLLVARGFPSSAVKKNAAGIIEGRHLIQYAAHLEFTLLEPDL